MVLLVNIILPNIFLKININPFQTLPQKEKKEHFQIYFIHPAFTWYHHHIRTLQEKKIKGQYFR